jgi:hypothetical protein
MSLRLLQAEEALTPQRVENLQAIPDFSSHPLQSIRSPCKQEYLVNIRVCVNYPKAADVLKKPYSSVCLVLLQAEAPSTPQSTRKSLKEVP